MKFADKYLPPLSDGKYTISVRQSTTSKGNNHDPVSDSFESSKEFSVSSRAFTLLQSDVFSVYPPLNAEGDYLYELPFLTAADKTFPWLFGNGDVPWTALIAVNESENFAESDITIEQLLTGAPENIYFPTDKMPSIFSESKTDYCHVLDIPVSLFQNIMPKSAETKYLCHGKYADLSYTEENVGSMDGYFSVIVGNRFIPEGKNTVHLVSTIGYPDYDSDIYSKYADVRLVSLFHWNVFCKHVNQTSFKAAVENIDTGIFKGTFDNTLSQRGVCAKTHYTRSGDTTGSLYHSPLVPYVPDNAEPAAMPCRSGDSLLIYDKDTGIFDVTYSAAWQLGRIIAMSEKKIIKIVSSCRNILLNACFRKNILSFVQEHSPDYISCCKQLTDVLAGPERREYEKDKD